MIFCEESYRRFRVHCNSIATRERFERALQAQGFKPVDNKKEFDRFKLVHIHPDSIIYYVVWEDGIYTLSDMPKSFIPVVDDIDYINGRQVVSKAKWLRQQIDKLEEDQQ